jgi:uncharacterized protein (DUF924 family)
MTDDAAQIREVLDFWFAPETEPRWFTPDPAFDQECRARLGPLVARAAAGELDGWAATAAGCLALCILLDQMPRNIFRGRPQAFATDTKAAALVRDALARGLDRQLTEQERSFLYLPMMHSEELADQERSVELYKALGNEEGAYYAEDHAAIIRRFGRFPHRNAILGRTSTAAELTFLAEHSNSYGQSASTEDALSTQPRPSDQGSASDHSSSD